MSDAHLSPHRVELTRLPAGRVWLLLCISIALWPRASAAQVRAPIPELTSERVYVIGVDDEYRSLRDEIAQLERTSPQTYYVVILRSAGPGRRATRDYLEALVGRWEDQARQKRLKFDRRRSVIIVVAIENKKIIVSGGEELQERYGFRDPSIERDLLSQHFYPYARAGDYAQGLRVLVAQIDQWIAVRDKDLVRQREEVAAREAQLRGDARSALAAGRILQNDARKELDTRKAAGLDVRGLEARFRAAAGDLDAAARQIDASASEALDLTQQGQRALQGVLDQLRHLRARQAELGDRIQSESALSGELLKAIEQAGREGLPTAPVQRQFDEATQLIELATQAVKTDPDRAETLVSQIERRQREALDHAKRLPDLRRQADQKAKAVTALEQSTAAELDRARRSGAPLGDIEKDWERARKQMAAARADAGTDDRKALDALTSAEAIMTRVRDEARVRLDRHRLYTRTVPLALLGALGLGGLAALGLLYYRKRHLQGIVAEQFQGFREKAVALMDQLDGLRQRHKTLPATDPDFTAPLSGATLALYNEVEADLNGLWDRWLKAMEVWDKAQKLIRAGSGLAIKQTEEARKLLEEGDIDELIRQSNSCKERLDRLNRGHEQARDALKAGQRELAALRKSFDQSAEAGLSTVSNPKEIATAETMLTMAEGMIPADPIGAEEIIVRSRQALAAATARPDQKPTRPREARPSYGPVDEVAAAAAKFRSVMARLGFTNLMGFLVRAWIAVWALALLIGLLTPLMPLVLFVLGFVVILAGLWALWRTVASWFWFGM